MRIFVNTMRYGEVTLAQLLSLRGCTDVVIDDDERAAFTFSPPPGGVGGGLSQVRPLSEASLVSSRLDSTPSTQVVGTEAQREPLSFTFLPSARNHSGHPAFDPSPPLEFAASPAAHVPSQSFLETALERTSLAPTFLAPTSLAPTPMAPTHLPAPAVNSDLVAKFRAYLSYFPTLAGWFLLPSKMTRSMENLLEELLAVFCIPE